MNVIFAILGAAVIAAIVIVISTLFLMLGWHLFAVSYLGLKMITFAQAFGLSTLAGAIFGSSRASSSKS
jgi:hypothetical protein